MKNKKSKTDISSVLKELNEMENQSTENPIVKEIFEIDTRSFNMAQLVNQNAKERAELKNEAIELMIRLDSLSKKLEEEYPEEYSKVTDQISESQLDLMYVEMENDMLSLRLGNYLKDTYEDQQSLTQTQDITKIKLAINNFLTHSGRTDLLGIETTIEPIKKFDEVRGPYWEIRTPNERIRVSRGDLPKVIRFSSNDFPERPVNPSPRKAFTEDDALQKATNLVVSQVSGFKKRNFILSTEYNEDSYYFEWSEQQPGELESIPLNRVRVDLERESLRLTDYYVFDFPRGKSQSPKISKKEAEEIARDEWGGNGIVRKVKLWERLRDGGKDVRTVWTVELSFKNPEGEALEHVVIDAITGEILDGKRF